VQHLFIEQLLILLTTGLVAGLLCRAWNLPPLMGYLAVGAMIGKGALNWVPVEEAEIEHLAELGVFFLLFSIGLELSPDELRRMSRHLLTGGPVQMLVVAVPITLGLVWLGWGVASSVLIASALAFSSTVLVFKALGELGQTSTSIGRRSIAILLFQDAALVPLLLCVPLLASPDASPGIWQWFVLGCVSICFLVATITLRDFLCRSVIPRITRHRSTDLVVLLTLSVLGLVTLVAYKLGLPPAVGAFAAGLAFGGNRWSEQIDSLILPFREVFAAIFFVSLGLLIDLSAILGDPLVVVGGILVLTLVKTAAAVAGFWVTGLSARRSIGPALGLAHVGEFAFVILLLASSSGMISGENQQRVLGIAGGTLLISPLLIQWGFRRRADDDDIDSDKVEPSFEDENSRTAVVIGMGPVGRAVVARLETLGYDVHAVDLNPLNLQSFAHFGIRIVAGDATTLPVLKACNADTAGMLVICVPVDEVAIRVTAAASQLNPSAHIVVRCRYAKSRGLLVKAGADYVVAEEAQAATELLRIIETSFS
jgi:monovalent cation:H+ antiporter-2, CPA2 family